MSDETTTTTAGIEFELIEGATSAIRDTLVNGQSRTLGEMSRSNAPIDSLIRASEWAANKNARTSGARPLFRRLNLNGIGY
jgi:hypothetical protein